MRKKKVEEIKEVKEEVVLKEVPEFCFIKIGETLKDVSKKFGISEEELKKLNGEVFGGNQIKLR